MACGTILVLGITGLVVSVLYFRCTNKTPEVPVTWAPGWWGRGPPKPDETKIHSFKISVPEVVLQDLKHRLENTRYGEDLENGDFNYGFQASYLKKVITYWKDEYDWRKHESILNSFPNFKTQIQGIDVHFMHVKPTGNVKGKPLLMVHGWPGSIWEFYKILPMLTDPVKHGGKAEDAFEVIVPSIPGYGFSESPHQKGFDQADAARMFVELMERLGFTEFYTQGGDWGGVLTAYLAANYPKKVLGAHLNIYMPDRNGVLATLHNIASILLPSVFLSKQDQEIIKTFSFINLLEESGYLHLQATKPDTIGTGLNDSPAGLAAYILEKFSSWTDMSSRSLPDGALTKKYTLDELLTNVMIYWVNGNIAASQRFYKEWFHSEEVTLLESLPVTVPSGLACFPHEVIELTEKLASYIYKDIIQFTVMPRGGHFAAFEEPQLLVNDIWTFVRKVEEKKMSYKYIKTSN